MCSIYQNLSAHQIRLLIAFKHKSLEQFLKKHKNIEKFFVAKGISGAMFVL